VTLLLASLPFLLVMAFTPGPNNIMVATSGVNFGFRATVPHILGVAFGIGIMMVAVGFGLGQLFLAVPALHTVLKVVSIAYLGYLAWRIARTTALSGERRLARPLTIFQAAAFQWVNVKGWVVVVGAITTYTVVGPDLPRQVLALAAVNAVIGLSSVACWTAFGHFLRGYLGSATHLRWFNYSMAALLLASILPMLFEG
jgi:threonine/homoserine/homoserine lactone efflux protein